MLQHDLSRCGVQEIISPDDLIHLLDGVVDNNRQVVRRNSVSSGENDIIYRSAVVTGKQVGELPVNTISTQMQ